MNIRKVLTAVTATAVFLCSSIFVQADYSDDMQQKITENSGI